MTFKSILAAALLLGAAAPALAHSNTRPLDARHARQEHRIEHGVRTGRLTPYEAHKLQHNQARIAHMKRQAGADGVVTWRERERIRAAQYRQSRAIEREKHDHQHAFPRENRRDYPY